MKRILSISIALFLAVFPSEAEVSLEQCIEAATVNYPLIKKYELISSTERMELSAINNGWLPKIGVFAQGSVQNAVPSFPSALSKMMQHAGGEIHGLGKLQYKIGLELNQPIWDGGVSKSQREVSRRQSIVDRASLDVEMYNIRERVESFYFGILLLQSQIEQIESTMGVYDSNFTRLRSMLKNGTAMQSDVDMIEAQLLTIKQQHTSALFALKGYRDALSLFTGLNISEGKLTVPEAGIPSDLTVQRPELELFNAQEALNNSRRESVNATLMPKIGMFAQTFYGYPGFDYFKDMLKRDMSFNIMAGIKVSWNLDSFYNKKNSLRKIEIADRLVDTQRETFIYNNSIQKVSELDKIHGFEAMIKDDARLIELRRNVRVAAESQLRNGIIDVTALVTKINDETQARLNASYHIIQRIEAIYNLKNTINR